MTIKLRQATVTREFDNWQRANNYGPYQIRARELGIGPNIIEPAVNAPTTDELAVAFVTAAEQIDRLVEGRAVTMESEWEKNPSDAAALRAAWKIMRDVVDFNSSGGTVRP